ncbi:cobaltochelatase subunit CobN [Aureibacter tunicatorum]|uniref:Cobaltochelatase CobN n=1 Tax=Aureibacter tunicatorum TaxID=866807 RepID=A0AAE4BUR2_9BACT|nr:cobaltochelatase subunit CobN [Aureibacter tunicatorum]MDR6242036.1 cobaltochelatase CobN [Aureibacter tunicatorum]BDD07120.1 hypothetical protein AUTU_46030 [Aureibacter tunicatorum]
MIKRIKRTYWVLLAIPLLMSIAWAYYRWVAPTKIAFLNYPDFSIARIQKSNASGWINIETLDRNSIGKARNYDALFIFGRGLHLSPSEKSSIEQAGLSGLPIFTEGATNPNMDLTNLMGKNLDLISLYMKYGGSHNYRNMLSYIRGEMSGKLFGLDEIAKPKEISRNVLFHLEETELFEDVASFETHMKSKNALKNGQAKVALFTSVPGPFNSNRDHLDEFIRKLESHDLNVYPVSAVEKRLKFLKEISPDIVLMMPHGRLSLGQDQECQQWLREKNIPLLTPISVFQPYEDWLKNPQGFFGPMLSMSIALPELDGAAMPYVVTAQYKDENGYNIFKAIPERMDAFCEGLKKRLALKQKKNADKKIAIVYFKGPGNNAMVASNMEIIPSLYNLLKRLKNEGYDLGELPDSSSALWDLIQQKGPVLGPYAEGKIEKFIKQGNPEIISPDQYEAWSEKSLYPEMSQAVEKEYGGFPGEYMSVMQDTVESLALSRVELGNIVLIPQPLPAVGEDSFSLIHGADIAPPYPYISAYLWARHGFGADAILHFGTHGSLEFTPGKQVALSGYDWTDALIGNTPHYYLYTISNVGEGIIAKRRSYATLVSHLTSPFLESGVYGDLKTLQDKLLAYTNVSGNVKQQYLESITQLSDKLGILSDLGIENSEELSNSELNRLVDYVQEISQEKITAGLYTLGEAYENEHLTQTVKLMAIDPIAYNLAEMDKIRGKISEKDIQDVSFFEKNYRSKASGIIHQVNEGKTFKELNLITSAEMARAQAWYKANPTFSQSDIIKGFISMGDRKGSSKKPKKGKRSQRLSDDEQKKLEDLLVNISTDQEKVDFILKMKSDKNFKMYSGLLDSVTLKKARKIAVAIPAMKKAIEIGNTDDMKAVIRIMQKEEGRKEALALLEDPRLSERIVIERQRKKSEARDRLSSDDFKAKLAIESQVENSWNLEKLQSADTAILFALSHWDMAQDIFGITEKDLKHRHQQVLKSINKKNRTEQSWAEAVASLQKTINDLPTYKELLSKSPDMELDALVNSFDGGYLLPSSGGDPITNPSTVPTGRNLYSIDAEKTPSKESWEVGKALAESLIDDYQKKHNAFPKKVSFTLWSGSFIETEGATLAEILYLLGVEPVRDPFGRVMNVKLIPMEELGRPRIDVIVQTSGQLRDLAASRLKMINKAVAMASKAEEKSNYVREGSKLAQKVMMEKGLTPLQSRKWADQRVFGGVNGNYGTNIMGMVEKADRWKSEEEIARTYIHNMGALYGGSEDWGAFEEGVFEAMLQQTEAVVQPRQSNTWGALSLDHVYEFMGGINLAVRTVTGKDPEGYFNDFRNPSKAKVQGIKEAIGVESRTTLLNPKYIEEYMQGEATSAETFAETFRNTFGWNVMKPTAIREGLWQDLYEVYVNDKHNLDVKGFFEDKNPYALQEMTAVLLESAHKGYWQASEEDIRNVSNLHAQLVKDFDAGCSEFVCDNQDVRDMVSRNASEELSVGYEETINNVREKSRNDNSEALVLESDSKEKKVSKEERKQAEVQEMISIRIVLLGLAALVLVIAFVWWRKRKSYD